MSGGNYYESDRALSEYLLFQYGAVEEQLPAGFAVAAATNFATRCVAECLDLERLPAKARGLDLGCAVGRAAFELARHCVEVVGIDSSERFITIAGHLLKNGSFLFGCIEEGDLTRPCQAIVPREIDRGRARFLRGDAMNLPRELGAFDVVLLANLIDRLNDPRRCLEQLKALVNPGGQLVVTSPYAWQAEYTPKENWLGGYEQGGKRVQSFDTIREILSPDFRLAQRKDMPFLIRENARKYQLAIAEASVWAKK